MTLRVAINGFGRIGRNVLRGWISRGADTGLEIVGMNSTSDPATSAHLLTYDSILGRLDPSVDIKTTDSSMFVNGKEIKFFADRNPLNCPWKEWGVDPPFRFALELVNVKEPRPHRSSMVVATRQSDSIFSSGRLLDEDKINKALNNASELGAEYAEIRLVSQTTNTASLKDGKLERAIPG